MSDLVLPVALVDTSVAINALQVLPAFGSPASGGELVAPAANTRLADTGALAAGTYTFTVWVGASEGNTGLRIRRRNAADAADIWLQRFGSGAAFCIQVTFRTPLAAN